MNNSNFLSVVICSIVKEDSILLIERNKGDYTGYWALVGGKVENGEHLREAALRECREETGLDTKFKELKSIISEHLKENNIIDKHFILYLIELEPLSSHVKESEEGKLHWVSIENLEEFKEKIIPSDYQMIKEIIKLNKGTYYECVVDKSNFELEKFEKIH